MHYLIEFRFHGKAKFLIKGLINEINSTFGLGYKKAFPHITLAGPFSTSDEKRLIKDFNKVCVDSRLMSFEVNGFNLFQDKGVVFLEIIPSKELDEFRWNLFQTLKPYCKLSPFDYERDFAFHATLALKLTEEKLHLIKKFIYLKYNYKFKHFMIRSTLLKGGFILREYDFLLRRNLVRSQAKDKVIFSKTLELLLDRIK